MSFTFIGYLHLVFAIFRALEFRICEFDDAIYRHMYHLSFFDWPETSFISFFSLFEIGKDDINLK